MSELETHEALVGIAKIIRTQAGYIRGLHSTVVEMYEALLQLNPELESSLAEVKKTIRLFPAADQMIQNTDAIVQWLERS